MSKSGNPHFVEVIEHIEDALNPATNKNTSPPNRVGHVWSRPSYPPSKFRLTTDQPKIIPGNWNVASSASLTKRPSGTQKINRNFFSDLEMHLDVGTVFEMKWRRTYGTNYCKYYFRDKYPEKEDHEKMPSWRG